MYLYPKWIRIWHVLNAILFVILIVTGLSMQYTDQRDYVLVVGFETAVRWHNTAAIILTINYIIFVAGNIITRNGKYYNIRREQFFSDLFKQLRYYSWGMFNGEKHPFPVTMERKFNPLQKVSYVLAMYVALPLVIISGIGLLFPEIVAKGFMGVSGMLLTDLLHITTGFILSVFMLIHIYTCTLGKNPGTLFRGMITGYHATEDHYDLEDY
jgi:thiosulfate reductase cytochrome b subunit